MKTCPKENLIVGFVFKELDKEQQRSFATHLKSCPHCQSMLAEFRASAKQIRRTKRPSPEKEIALNYKKVLQNSFYPRFNVLHQVSDWVESFFLTPSPVMRLSQAVAMLLVGILLGRVVFFPAVDQNKNIADAQTVLTKHVSDQLLHHYLQETEMIFLDVLNTSQDENPQIIESVKQLAKFRRLLEKTVLCREHAEELNDPILINLIDEIELILLDLCNAEDDNLTEIMQNARNQIKDSHILLEINSLEHQQI